MRYIVAIKDDRVIGQLINDNSALHIHTKGEGPFAEAIKKPGDNGRFEQHVLYLIF